MKWLDRTLMTGPYVTLCTSQDEYEKVCRKFKVSPAGQYVHTGSHATMHTFQSDGESACVVCIATDEDTEPAHVYGMLVHEAVHIWQQHCEDIGEDAPGVEQEAYAVQSIAQELIEEYLRVCAESPAR